MYNNPREGAPQIEAKNRGQGPLLAVSAWLATTAAGCGRCWSTSAGRCIHQQSLLQLLSVQLVPRRTRRRHHLLLVSSSSLLNETGGRNDNWPPQNVPPGDEEHHSFDEYLGGANLSGVFDHTQKTFLRQWPGEPAKSYRGSFAAAAVAIEQLLRHLRGGWR